MDVLYFLQQRTRFIRDFYDLSSQPFLEVTRKIEAGIEPYEPPFSESSEPAFLGEWMEAGTSIQLLGRTCISMLSASLKLYFGTWEGQLGIKCNERSSSGSNVGFLRLYQACFGANFGVDWNACPANLSILEQVILARNRDQHPASITSFNVIHDKRTLTKYPEPFFVHKEELQFLSDPDSPGQFLIDPNLHVSKELLSAAIEEVERLAIWLDPLLSAAKYRRPT